MRFWTDIRGNVAILFTTVMPVLLVGLGMAVDYGVWVNQKQELQRIADEAALAAARELYLANTSGPQAESVAQTAATASFASAGMTADSGGGTDPSGSGATGSGTQETTFGGAVKVDVNVDLADGSVGVTVVQEGAGFFAPLSIQPPIISVTAVATARGGGRVCVIALDPDEAATVDMQQDSQITAPECGVFSNSTNEEGIVVGSRAAVSAELICSAGGVGGNELSYQPSPTTDCPAIEDPLASRPAPTFGSCDHEDLVVNAPSGVTVLSPGVYCGGIEIMRGDVEFDPGVYVIKDGPLAIVAASTVRGEDVGFYFTGDNAVYNFGSHSDIDLAAPTSGPLAGILFFEDRNAPLNRRHVISSIRADNLLGTVYLPRGTFVVSTNSRVADQSAYTAIVARRIELTKAPNLYLNADYDSTSVPVPDGVGPKGAGRTIYLEK